MAALGLSCGTQELHGGTWASLIVACGILSGRSLAYTQTLEHMGSLVVASGILVPRPRIEPTSATLGVASEPWDPQGRPQMCFFLDIFPGEGLQNHMVALYF